MYVLPFSAKLIIASSSFYTLVAFLLDWVDLLGSSIFHKNAILLDCRCSKSIKNATYNAQDYLAMVFANWTLICFELTIFLLNNLQLQLPT